jgi:hypothetical protein
MTSCSQSSMALGRSSSSSVSFWRLPKANAISSLRQTSKDVHPPAYTVEPQTGVRKVELVNRVWCASSLLPSCRLDLAGTDSESPFPRRGRNSKIALTVGIALASYIYVRCLSSDTVSSLSS